MQEIIQPVDKKMLKAELNEETFVRATNNAQREIYVVSYHDSPHVMDEIGRLREMTFRYVGGGTGKEKDIDKYDTAESAFKQLIVWDPKEEEIVGGYRFIEGDRIPRDENGKLLSATSKLFDFSKKFVEEYVPYTIELGRSFVQPMFQPTVNLKKGLYSLDNLWDGLGAIIVENPHIKYYFGKFTMYPTFNRYARDIILRFLNKYFPDDEDMIRPYNPLPLTHNEEELDAIFTGNTYQENYKILVQTVRKHNENIPPLVNSYMNLSPTMKTFGTSLNPTFGDVEETGILITIKDMYEAKTKRHIASYTKK